MPARSATARPARAKRAANGSSRLLDEALDDDLTALVVRVDLPGGTVTGSEAIRRAILRHKAKGIPIVVSMGNFAASGGYWVSTPAERIFAEPETVTGSIGVFGVVPTFENTLDQLGREQRRRQDHAAFGPARHPRRADPGSRRGAAEDGRARLRRVPEPGRQVARQDRRAQIDAIAQGRVWTGGTARQIGLVDQFGDLDDALAYAAEKAGSSSKATGTRNTSAKAASPMRR